MLTATAVRDKQHPKARAKQGTGVDANHPLLPTSIDKASLPAQTKSLNGAYLNADIVDVMRFIEHHNALLL